MENGKSRLQQVQDDAEEVKCIMLGNLEKAHERTGKLGELEQRADELLVKSKAFQKTTTNVKQRTQWQAMKTKVLLGTIVAAVLIVLIIVLIIIYRNPGSETSTPTDGTKR